MKVLTCLIISFTLFYYVQNVSLTSFFSFSEFRDYLTGRNAVLPADDQLDGDLVCYPPLGCFNKTAYNESDFPTTGIFAPDTLDHVNLTIYHFTDLETKGQRLAYNSTKVDAYLKDEKVYFLIHGWENSFGYGTWQDNMKDTILQLNNGSANVFVVDWSKIASFSYPVSAENTKLIGRAIGYFITKTLVKNYGLQCDDVHVLGHSLGGQTAGFVGKYAKANNCFIKRITALDAAGPFFRSSDANQRINASDAFFVEALHTNAAPSVLLGLGTNLKVGIVNYSPNGGSTQTGCSLLDKIKDDNQSVIDLGKPSCSHQRAPEIYSTNFDKLASCQLVGYQCKDYDSYTKGECGDCGDDLSKCRLIGLSKYHDPTTVPLPKSDEDFYVTTSADAPYCYHTYQVKVRTGANVSKAIGSLHLNVIDRKRDVKNVKIESPVAGLAANTTYTTLIHNDSSLEVLEQVEIYFDVNLVGDALSLIGTVAVAVDEIQVNYLSHIDPSIRKQYSGTFVPQSHNHQVSKSSENRTVFDLSD